MEKSKHVVEFMKLTTHSRRISYLDKLQQEGQYLPLSLVQDLMLLNLEETLQKGLLSVVDNSDRLALEDYLTRGVLSWQQNLASHAISIWSDRTDHLLWYRLLPLATNPQTPQRVAYTLLQYAKDIGGAALIRRFLRKDLLADRSGAFLSMLIERAMAWDICDTELLSKCLPLSSECFHGEDKAALSKFFYLLDFDKEKLKTWGWRSGQFDSVADLVRKLSSKNVSHVQTKLSILTKEIAEGDTTDVALAMLEDCWPPLWERKTIDDATLEQAYRSVCAMHKTAKASELWSLFGGIGSEKLARVLLSTEDDSMVTSLLHLFGHLLCAKDRKNVITEIGSRIGKNRGKGSVLEFIQSLPPVYRMEANNVDDEHAEFFGEINKEICAFEALREIDQVFPFSLNQRHSSLRSSEHAEDEITCRRRFFACAYEKNGSQLLPEKKSSIWELLHRAYLTADEGLLNDLALQARRAAGLWHFCYIDTLGRYQGCDKAVLRLLDYIRSDDEKILHAVAYALSGIGTPRALQELVSFFTRPNIRIPLKHEIIQLIRRYNLSNLQAELRSAVHDIKADSPLSMTDRDLCDALESLISTPNAVANHIELDTDQGIGGDELDRHLSEKLYCFSQLSSEVKRSLRTAQFFHMLVEKSENLTTIDLSPAIDMQYKAMELLFRETFENAVSEILCTGVMQRKLDVLGYARAIVGKMDEYENFIQNLPIISSIPFFSKFKLRKMLQGICQFRPGKRFTLDGLKAFSLFFLCFSRKNCRYGMHDIFPIPNVTDEQLFSFVKDLHMFQDFRNRAAHEGFHPEKSNDLSGLWNYTIKIVLTVERIREAMSSSSMRQVS